MTRHLSFAPVSRPDARVLVLGSLPGAELLRRQEYYAKSQNAFWRIMGELVGAGPDLPYAQRLEQLTSAGLAPWDVCASARREGSLDAKIQDMEPNDFARFFDAHGQIALIGFNGQTAAKLFERFVAPETDARSWQDPAPMFALDESRSRLDALCAKARHLARGAHALSGRRAMSSCSVCSVERSAIPSTRSGRKWRWNAATASRVASS